VLVCASAVKNQTLAPTLLCYKERGDTRPRCAGEAENAAPEESREKEATRKGIGAKDHVLVLTFSLVRLPPLNDVAKIPSGVGSFLVVSSRAWERDTGAC
jgi:hypothetical protein